MIEGAGVFAGVGVPEGVGVWAAVGADVIVEVGVAIWMPGVGVGSVGAEAQPASESSSSKSNKAIGRMRHIVPGSGSCANHVFTN